MRMSLPIVIVIVAGCQQQDTQPSIDLRTTQSAPNVLEIGTGTSHSIGPENSFTFRYCTTLASGTFVNQPKWDAGTPSPPLPPHNAIIVATKYIDSLVADDKFRNGSVLDRIELHPFDLQHGDWFYVVRFTFEMRGDTIPYVGIPYVGIAVLMDGTVVRPDISERIDIGWPLPGSVPPSKPDNLTDVEIVKRFISTLNADRQFAGQTVGIQGQLRKTKWDPTDHGYGYLFHLALEDGTKLFFEPLYTPKAKTFEYNVDLKITGQLIGFRDLDDRDSDWQDLDLAPGIRITHVEKIHD